MFQLSKSFSKNIPAVGDLTDAVDRGDIESVKSLLRRGADPNEDKPDPFSDTPLVKAAWGGHADILELLLEKGALPDRKNKDGAAPLAMAGAQGNIKALELLLGKGASIDQQGNSGYTPLMLAAANGRPEATLFLIAKGASLDVRNKDGETACMIAELSLASRTLHSEKETQERYRETCRILREAAVRQRQWAIAQRKLTLGNAVALRRDLRTKPSPFKKASGIKPPPA